MDKNHFYAARGIKVVIREDPGLLAALLQIPDHAGEGVHLPVAGLHDARPVPARDRD
jgi:hypothetical protein